MTSILNLLKEAISPTWWPAIVSTAIAILFVLFLNAQAMAEIEDTKQIYEAQLTGLEAKLDALDTKVEVKLDNIDDKLTQQSSDIQFIRGFLEPRAQ